MKISATEEYGLRCIVNVARRFDADEPMTAQEVAESEGISVPYAQKLLRLLSQADLIESRRGVGGGYVLARHPDRVTVGDVVRALDADFETAGFCEKHTGDLDVCTHAGGCNIRPVWSFIEDFIATTLDGLTLAVLLQGSGAVNTQLRSLAEIARANAGGQARAPQRKIHCPVADITATAEG